MKIRAKINEIEHKQWRKLTKINSRFFENINTLDVTRKTIRDRSRDRDRDDRKRERECI